MKPKKICCPHCGKSDKIYTRCLGEEGGKILGTGIGSVLSGYIMTGGILLSAGAGFIIPGVGPLIGGTVGGIGSLLSGAYSGMVAGREIGKQIDKEWFSELKCFHCHKTFKH